MSKKVSIIVPVYNVAQYLRQFIDSILSQTYKDIELICVDDGSTDESVEILKSYGDRIMIVHQKNRVHLVLARTEANNKFDYAQVVDLVVRFTPDAIIGGEISTTNAGAIWELMNSGHDNCFATIHAESPEAAYQAFISHIMHSNPMLDQEKTQKEMREKLRVVQINRDGNIRAITAIT